MSDRGARNGDSARAFIALEIDEPVKRRVGETMAGLKSHVRGVRWVQAEGLHLTLRFLGESTLPALEELKEALSSAARLCPPCEARVQGMGVFPEHGSPRVLWLGVSLPGTVLALQQACEAAAEAAGFPPEGRPFRSHLTLGRWRDEAPRPRLPAVDLGVASLDTLVLMRSDLQPTGARYTPLARFPLGGA